VFTHGTILHIDSSDGGAARWRQLAQRIIPELDIAMEPALCDGTSVSSVTPPGTVPRCHWLGSPPILRQHSTDALRVFLAAGDTDTAGTLAISACAMMDDVRSTGKTRARMITPPNSRQRRARLLLDHRTDRRIRSLSSVGRGQGD
jgi:hypothetical protein